MQVLNETVTSILLMYAQTVYIFDLTIDIVIQVADHP